MPVKTRPTEPVPYWAQDANDTGDPRTGDIHPPPENMARVGMGKRGFRMMPLQWWNYMWLTQAKFLDWLANNVGTAFERGHHDENHAIPGAHKGIVQDADNEPTAAPGGWKALWWGASASIGNLTSYIVQGRWVLSRNLAKDPDSEFDFAPGAGAGDTAGEAIVLHNGTIRLGGRTTASGTGPIVDGLTVDVATGNVAAAGSLSAATSIAATNNVTAGLAITADLGDITATVGDVMAGGDAKFGGDLVRSTAKTIVRTIPAAMAQWQADSAQGVTYANGGQQVVKPTGAGGATVVTPLYLPPGAVITQIRAVCEAAGENVTLELYQSSAADFATPALPTAESVVPGWLDSGDGATPEVLTLAGDPVTVAANRTYAVRTLFAGSASGPQAVGSLEVTYTQQVFSV